MNPIRRLGAYLAITCAGLAIAIWAMGDRLFEADDQSVFLLITSLGVSSVFFLSPFAVIRDDKKPSNPLFQAFTSGYYTLILIFVANSASTFFSPALMEAMYNDIYVLAAVIFLGISYSFDLIIHVYSTTTSIRATLGARVKTL